MFVQTRRLSPQAISQRSNGLHFKRRTFLQPVMSMSSRLSQEESLMESVSSLSSLSVSDSRESENSDSDSDQDEEEDNQTSSSTGLPCSHNSNSFSDFEGTHHSVKSGVTKSTVSTVRPPSSSKQYPPYKYRSLLLPFEPTRGGSRSMRRRIAGSRGSSLSSVRRLFRSSHHLTSQPYKDINCMPNEIMLKILALLDQRDVTMCLYVNKNIYSAAVRQLYKEPFFSSTYRFAQFVTQVSHNDELASYVQKLDLSTIKPGFEPGEEDAGKFENEPTEEDTVLAGWRDWKLRGHPLYSRQLKRVTKHPYSASSNPNLLLHSSLKKKKSVKTAIRESKLWLSFYKKSKLHDKSDDVLETLRNQPNSLQSKPKVPFSTPHPTSSPFLRQYSTSKDIPVGYLIHVVAACKNLNYIDISFLPLAEDYAVAGSSLHLPTASSGLLFVSDVAKLHTWKPDEILPVSPSDLVVAILQLNFLQVLKLRKLMWVKFESVLRLVNENNSLEMLDLTDSGLVRGARWAIEGSVDDFRAVIG